jgi:hypothetical protein
MLAPLPQEQQQTPERASVAQPVATHQPHRVTRRINASDVALISVFGGDGSDVEQNAEHEHIGFISRASVH